MDDTTGGSTVDAVIPTESVLLQRIWRGGRGGRETGKQEKSPPLRRVGVFSASMLAVSSTSLARFSVSISSGDLGRLPLSADGAAVGVAGASASDVLGPT